MTGRDMRIAFALAAALAPLAASAATLTVNGSSQDVRIGFDQCKALGLAVNWTLSTAAAADRVRLIGASSGSSACGATTATTPPDHTFVPDKTPTSLSESFAIQAQDMVLINTDAGVQPCDDPQVTQRSSANPLTNTLCVQRLTTDLFNTLSLGESASVSVKFALAPPFPPDNVQITPGDRHLKVFWSKGDPAEDIAQYQVHVVSGDGGTPGNAVQTVTSTNADVSKTDDGQTLLNDAGYVVTVVAKDTYSNVSEPSIEVTGFPVATADFYDHYRDLGGRAQGGCSSSGASVSIAVAALALALLLRRRRRARNGSALIALFALLAPAARADEQLHPRFLIAFKMDRYDPRIDSEPGLTGRPYHDVFHGRAPPRYQLEFDWEVAHPFGALLVGATVGFWQNTGKALLRSSTPGNLQPSGDTATLNIFPFGLIATYRFDWLANRWERFPFIPYAQIGLMRAYWASLNGTGDISVDRVNGGRGAGWVNGYTTALGIALNLNAVDPSLAREAYNESGIQRTSLFAEYGWTHLNNFNKSGALVLSDHAWRFGLAVEF